MRKSILIGALCFLSVSGRIYAQDEKKWTLEDCINYALEQNIQVRKNVLSNKSLELQAEQTKAERLPSVNGSIGQNFNWNRNTALDGDGNIVYESGYNAGNSSSYSLSSAVTIFDASRITNQIRQSEMNVESGKYDLEATKESISLNILNAFLQVLYAGEQVKNSEKQMESTSQQVMLAAERLTLKAISQADYLQVKSQLASEKLNLANAMSQLAIARVNLMQLMELPVSEDFDIDHPDLEAFLNQKLTPDVQEVYKTALGIKPQIKNAAISKEIAFLDQKIARSGYFPSLSASAGLSTSYSNNSGTAYFDQAGNGITPSIGFSLSVPIYQKKQIKTNIELARIGYQNAELAETDVRNQLRKSIEQATLDVSTAQVEYDASIEKFQATKEASLLSDEKFIQGLINSVDYLVSKTNLIVAESQLLQSKYKLIFSYKILDFYLGIPFSL